MYTCTGVTNDRWTSRISYVDCSLYKRRAAANGFLFGLAVAGRRRNNSQKAHPDVSARIKSHPTRCLTSTSYQMLVTNMADMATEENEHGSLQYS